MIGFFDRYSCFDRHADGPTSGALRLNLRWLGIIGAQSHVLAGKRVLEAGCWNGRWLFAALQAGARHVVGIEQYSALADEARRNLEMLGVPSDRYTIVTGDFFQCVGQIDDGTDTLLVPGFVDNDLRNFGIFDYFNASSATHMVYDEWVVADDEPSIKLYQLWQGGKAFHSVPSAGAMAMFEKRYALSRTDFDYGAVLGAPTAADRLLFSSKGFGSVMDDPVIDYKVGARMTCRFAKQAAA